MAPAAPRREDGYLMSNPRRAAQPESRVSTFLGPVEQPPEYSHGVAIHLAVALAMILATLSLSDLTADPWYWVGPTTSSDRKSVV